MTMTGKLMYQCCCKAIRRLNLSPICVAILLLLSDHITSTSALSTPTTTATTSASSSSPRQPQQGTRNNRLATADDIANYANSTGTILSITTLGPGYRALARAKYNESLILGYCSGFIRPGTHGNKILHMDTMEVFKQQLKRASEQEPRNFSNGGTAFGVGLLLGALCGRHGFDSGCSTAELLAIDDEGKQHNRLVRHYKRLGLHKVRYVGEGIASIADRLVWGGRGTLMRGNIEANLKRYSPIFLREDI